ncbi:unnamed protein product [Colias eurytheme]|nr:unnamed protein product [Colias eurytheme]
MPSSNIILRVTCVTVCLAGTLLAYREDAAQDFFQHVLRIPNPDKVLNTILGRLERNRQMAARFKQRDNEEDCDESAESLPEYTESLQASREREMRQLGAQKHYPICHLERKIQRLNTNEFEYRPAYYEEITCTTSVADEIGVTNEICSSLGFSCVQWNKTIHLTRRRYSSDCWETLTMVIPAGCECMWPVHKLDATWPASQSSSALRRTFTTYSNVMPAGMSVAEFYKGKSVLVTGGTGFMGKVLVEKLLYSVPDIGNIYILMRPKRGKSVNQRLEEMQRLPLFDRIRNERPASFKKIKALQGDVLFENFGLSDNDIEKLSEEVYLVFHFAATLRLEAPLKDNVNMNTCGTQRTLNVAKRLKKLQLVVHLSTAFCYPDYTVLEEKIHAPTVQPSDIMRLIEWLDDKQLALLTPSLLGAHPNCYTFSKRLAESIVAEAFESLPVVIARPSIVCPALAEPLPGWVDNLNGPVGLMLGAGKGAIRSMLCDGSLLAQVIPVDTAINAIIALGMIESNRKEKPEVIPIYNINIGHQKPTTWGEVLTIAKDYGRKYPLAWPLWYPNGDITTNYALHEFKRIFYHLLPAYCIDFLLLITGQKRFMLRVQERISQGLEVLQYFTIRPWSFPCPNYDNIKFQLTEEDNKRFNTDLTEVDKVQYLHSCVEGGRVFCFKEDPNKIHLNRHYHNFLYFLDWIVKILFWLLILSFIARWFEPVRDLFSYGEPVVKHLPFLGPAVLDNH